MSVQIREKSYFGEKFRVLSYCLLPYTNKPITQNSVSVIFYGITKSLLTLWDLEETRKTWTMFSKLKALVDSEKFRVIVFQYSAKNDNSEFSLSNTIPGIRKILSYRFYVQGQKR